MEADQNPPHPADGTALSELGRMADAVLAMLESHQARADAGRAVDLAGIEESVALLCDRILALPKPEGRLLMAPLADLLHRTERLQATLPQPFV